MSLWEYANPKKFMATTDKVVVPAFVLAGALMAIGLVWGFFFTPDDFRQGSTVKIIYLHVPTAMLASNIDVCPSCPQACILPGTVEAWSNPVSSMIGKASISALSPTTRPEV